MTDDVEAVARAICRVQLNGGNPDQPAARWNGTKIELQDFPAWWDYRDETRHAIAALRSLGWQKVEPGIVVVPREPTEAMIAACRAVVDEWRRGDRADATDADIYRAMIAAADNKKPAPIAESAK